MSQILAEPQIAVLCVHPRHGLLPSGEQRPPTQGPQFLLRADIPLWKLAGPRRTPRYREEVEQRPEFNLLRPALFSGLDSPLPNHHYQKVFLDFPYPLSNP